MNAHMFKNKINKMIRNDLEKAFFALGLICKRCPSYKNMHNFGTFLSKYGHEVSFFSEKNISIAEKLLKLAKKEHESFITLKELGDLYLDQHKYKNAIYFYTKALKYNTTYSVYYNLAQCYYFVQDYVSMKNILEESIANSNFSNSEILSLQELLGFAFALLCDKQRALNILEQLQSNLEYKNSPETVKLAYLCDDYGFILQNYKDVFCEWVIEIVDYQIVYQAFIKANIGNLNEFKKWVNAEIIDFYNDNPDFECDPELIKEIETNENLPNVKLVLSPVFTCDFY